MTATESHLEQQMTPAWWVLLPHTVDYISSQNVCPPINQHLYYPRQERVYK